jgi:hypothetical protein
MVNVFVTGLMRRGTAGGTIRIVKFPAIDAKRKPVGGCRSRALVASEAMR